MQRAARSASFAAELSDLQRQVSRLLGQDGNLTPEEQRIVDRMRELYAEAEYLDVIRIGAIGVLEQGQPSQRFPRRVKEVIRDLSMFLDDGGAGVSI